jgi:acetylornithine deacetylase/succinyl-diaminopimelate desuccinylase-like protein
MKLTDQPLPYAHANRSRFLAELENFIRFPSVSAQPQHADDVKQCAAWLAAHLRQIGLQHVKIISNQYSPIVYAEWLHAPTQPTVLIYGHYDVQPADPLHEWHSPPFAPTVRGDDLYGRGACDDKGQMFTHVKALEAYLRTEGTLPVNVKCLFEGEEEIGSPHLTPFLARHTHALAADVALMSDMPILAPDRPAITYAMRGGLSLELELRGPQHDLHSGIFGGAMHNPLQALCDIIANLHDPGGRIAIPGFYDRVRHWSEAERDYMARAGPSDAQLLHNARAGTGWGESGYTLYERTTIRPALTVTGIVGGYQGPGVKAIIPARATAKLNFRLVPDQDPHEIDHLFRQHIASITPPTMRFTIRTHLKAKPALVHRRHPALRAAARAYYKGFGATPVFLRSGGTIPVVNTFHEVLGMPTVLMGFALPDDRMHAPNEKFHLSNFYRGIATSIHFLHELSAQPERTSRLRRPHLQVTSPRQAQEERTGQL